MYVCGSRTINTVRPRIPVVTITYFGSEGMLMVFMMPQLCQPNSSEGGHVL